MDISVKQNQLNKKDIINSLKHRGPDNQSIFEKYDNNNLFLALADFRLLI